MGTMDGRLSALYSYSGEEEGTLALEPGQQFRWTYALLEERIIISQLSEWSARSKRAGWRCNASLSEQQPLDLRVNSLRRKRRRDIYQSHSLNLSRKIQHLESIFDCVESKILDSITSINVYFKIKDCNAWLVFLLFYSRPELFLKGLGLFAAAEQALNAVEQTWKTGTFENVKENIKNFLCPKF